MDEGGDIRVGDQKDDEQKSTGLLESFRALNDEDDSPGRVRHVAGGLQPRRTATGTLPKKQPTQLWEPAPPDSRGRDKGGRMPESLSSDSSHSLDSDDRQPDHPRGMPHPPPPRAVAPPRRPRYPQSKRRVKFVDTHAKTGEEKGEEKSPPKAKKSEEYVLPDLPYGRLFIKRNEDTWKLRGMLRYEDFRTIFLQLAKGIIANPHLTSIDVRDNGMDCRAGAIIGAALKRHGEVEDACTIPIGDLSKGLVRELSLPNLGLPEAAILSIFLSGKGCEHLTSLDFSHCVTEMGTQGATALAKGLANLTGLAKLDLSHSGLSTDGMEVIAGGLEMCRTLVTLHLGTNMLDDRSGAILGHVLERNPLITDLAVGNNNLRYTGVVALAQGLRELRDLTALDVHNNQCGPEGATQLASVLKFTPALQVLNLGFNSIGVEGTRAIVDALPTFVRSLRLLRINTDMAVDKMRSSDELELINQGFREEETMLMAVIFRSNQSLHTLDLSLNHLGEEACQVLARTLALQSRLKMLNRTPITLDHTMEDQILGVLLDGLRKTLDPPLQKMAWDSERFSKRVEVTMRRHGSFVDKEDIEKLITQLKNKEEGRGDFPELPPMEVFEGNWRPVTAITDDESGPGGTHDEDDEEGEGDDEERYEQQEVNVSILDVVPEPVPKSSSFRSPRRSREKTSVPKSSSSKFGESEVLVVPKSSSSPDSPNFRRVLNEVSQKKGSILSFIEVLTSSKKSALDIQGHKGKTTGIDGGDMDIDSPLTGRQMPLTPVRRSSMSPYRRKSSISPVYASSKQRVQGRLNRKGTFRGRKGRSPEREEEEEEEEVLTKDEQLLASLNVFDKHLNYSGKMLGAKGVADLAHSIIKGSVEICSLDLTKNDMIGAGVERGKIDLMGARAVAYLIKHRTQLTSINLSWNGLNPESGVMLAHAMGHCPLVHSIDLYSNQIGAEGMTALASAVQNMADLTVLNIRYNDIGPEGAKALSSALRASPNITALDFAHCNIGLDGLVALLVPLSNCRGLTTLDLRGNEFGIEGDCKIVQLIAMKPFPGLERFNEVLIDGFLQTADEDTEMAVYERGKLANHEALFMAGLINQSLGLISLDRVVTFTVRVLKTLDFSHCNLTVFPNDVLALWYLDALNIAHNHICFLPIAALNDMPNLNQLQCEGNIMLCIPPPEIAALGGVVVLDYLREVVRTGQHDHEASLVFIGEAEAGKTCVVNALLSHEDKSKPISKRDKSFVAEPFRRWTPTHPPSLLSDLRAAAAEVHHAGFHHMAAMRSALTASTSRVSSPLSTALACSPPSNRLTPAPEQQKNSLPRPEGLFPAIGDDKLLNSRSEVHMHVRAKCPQEIPPVHLPFPRVSKTPRSGQRETTREADLRTPRRVVASNKIDEMNASPTQRVMKVKGKTIMGASAYQGGSPTSPRESVDSEGVEKGGAKTLELRTRGLEHMGSPEMLMGLRKHTEKGEKFHFHFEVMDIPGRGGGRMTTDAMLRRRSVYLYVWKLKRYSSHKAMMTGIKVQSKALEVWLEDLQCRQPGSGVVMVATHVDIISAGDLQEQSKAMADVVHAKMQSMSSWSQFAPLMFARSGASVGVNPMNGTGIAELRREIMKRTVGMWWYKEEAPVVFLKLRSALVAAREKREWLSCRNYAKLVYEHGLEKEAIPTVMTWMQGRGVLWYYGKPLQALALPAEELATDYEMNTVVISPKWVIALLQCLLCRSRDELITWFKGKWAVGSKDETMVMRVYALLTAGILHKDLVPYIWPQSPASEMFWARVRLEKLGAGLWQDNLADTHQDYGRILMVLNRMQLIQDWSGGNYFVPNLVSGRTIRTCDHRTVDDKTCKFMASLRVPKLPKGLTDKIIADGMGFCKRVDYAMWVGPQGGGVAAFYLQGDKTRVHFGPRRHGEGHDVTLTSSSQAALQSAMDCVERALLAFPGLSQQANFKVPEHQRDLAAPLQLLILHTFHSISFCEAIQRELQWREPGMRVALDQVPELDKLKGLLSGTARDVLMICQIDSIDKLRAMAFAKTGWGKAGTVKIMREVLTRVGMFDSDIATIDRVLNSPKLEAMCVLMCIDDQFQNPTECDLRDISWYASLKVPIIQVLMPCRDQTGARFIIESRIADTHIPCAMVDFRSPSMWDDNGQSISLSRTSRLEHTLLPQIKSVLDGWLGDPPQGMHPPGNMIPCPLCVDEGRHDCDYFDIIEAKQIMRDHLNARLCNPHSAPDQSYRLQCVYGHLVDPTTLVNRPIMQICTACSSCEEHGVWPPHAFSFWDSLLLASWSDSSLEQAQRLKVGPARKLTEEEGKSLASRMLMHNLKHRSVSVLDSASMHHGSGSSRKKSIFGGTGISSSLGDIVLLAAGGRRGSDVSLTDSPKAAKFPELALIGNSLSGSPASLQPGSNQNVRGGDSPIAMSRETWPKKMPSDAKEPSLMISAKPPSEASLRITRKSSGEKASVSPLILRKKNGENGATSDSTLSARGMGKTEKGATPVLEERNFLEGNKDGHGHTSDPQPPPSLLHPGKGSQRKAVPIVRVSDGGGASSSKKEKGLSQMVAIPPPLKGGYPIAWIAKTAKKAGAPRSTRVAIVKDKREGLEKREGGGGNPRKPQGLRLLRGRVLQGDVAKAKSMTTVVHCPKCDKDVELMSIIQADVYVSNCIPEPVCENCGVFTYRKLMPFRINDALGRHQGQWHCGRCEKRFVWDNPYKNQELSVFKMVDRLEKELGAVCMKHTLFIGRHGMTKAIQATTPTSIRGSSVFIAVLNDDYLRSPSSCKEFMTAVQEHKYVIPVITEPWTVPSVGAKWWPSDSIITTNEGLPLAMPWSMMRAFTPIDLRTVSKDLSKPLAEHDEVVQIVSAHMAVHDWAEGESETSKIYGEIHKARSAMLSALGEVGMMNPSELDEKCRKIFERMDADGGGTLDRDEIKEGLRDMGVSLSEEVVDSLVREADDDNSNALDLNEFKKLVFTLIASHTTGMSKAVHSSNH